MKIYFVLISCVLLTIACCPCKKNEETIEEIRRTEKSFEIMAAEKGISEAFYYYAADDAVIKRGNDSLIKGKASIKAYYQKIENDKTTVNWTPEFISVSECGDLAYTYGRYYWKIKNDSGDIKTYSGFFHTVWKKQRDNTWKYVWD